MEDVTELIGKTIADHWPGITIYRENKASGFNVPSFYVHRVNLHVDKQYFGYQLRKYSYQVVYFPDADHINQQLDRVSEEIAAYFEKIDDDYSHIRNLDIHIEDDTVKCTFDTEFRVKPGNSNEPKQSTLDFNGGLK